VIAWFTGQPLVFKIVLGLLSSLLFLYLLWLLWLRKYLEWQNVKTLEIEKRVGLKIEFIKTTAQILGGGVLLFGLYFTYQNLVETQEKNRADLFMAQEKHATELYIKAVEQLGSNKLEVRLGGIYALERIARDSEKDHGPIMEVLTAYVRMNAPWYEESQLVLPNAGKFMQATEIYSAPPPDIQAVLTVIGRRKHTYGKGEERDLHLHHVDLREVYLWRAHLEGVVLIRSNLEKVFLREAHLEGAHLNIANLKKAELDKAHLGGAHLEGANLEGAFLYNANLEKAHLEGADLSKAKGLTQEQIDSAIIDENTKLPDYLKKTGPNQAEPK